MSNKQYEIYTNTDIPWIQKLPSHWDIWKIATRFPVIGSGTTPKSGNEDFYEDGGIPWLNTGDLNDFDLYECQKSLSQLAVETHSTLKLYKHPSVVIALYGATIGKVAKLNFDTTVNQACCVISGRSDEELRYLFYTLLAAREHILSLSLGGGQPNISQDTVRTLRVAIPPEDEISGIVRFLDRETTKIDELIQKQERLIELLNEELQCITSRLIGRGPNTDVELKTSGVDLFDKHPKHWTVKKFKFCATLIQKKTEEKTNVVALENIESWTGKFIETDSKYEGDGISFERDDVLFGKLRPYLAKVYIAKNDGQAFGDILVFRGQRFINAHYLFHLILNDEFIKLVNSSTYGTKMPRANWDFIGNIKIPVPPLDEQHEIVKIIESKEIVFGNLTRKAHESILLLKEHRASLISAAVTGKIDVRELV